MKKVVLILLATAVVLSGCSQKPAKETIQQNQSSSEVELSQPTQPAQSPSPMTFDQWIEPLPDSRKSWTGMTTEDYLEDFDYLYKEMQSNYPYFGVAKRKADIDFDQRYLDTRKLLESCTNDMDFRNILLTDFYRQVGHLDLWGVRYMDILESLENFIKTDEELKKQFTPYLEVLNNPASKENYPKMDTAYNELLDEYDQYPISIGELAPEEDIDSEEDSQESSNVELEIIEEGKIAKIAVHSFDMNTFEADKETLFEYYEQIKDYDHLIFDITDNGGGGMGYFSELMVAPHISQSLTVPVYSFIKGGENNLFFLQIDPDDTGDVWLPIEQLPPLPKMNQDDLRELDFFTSEPYVIEPDESREKFGGKIWLLVSEMNYSASEFAAMFAKQSGFATLVGQTTGGDGIGTDPVYIVMPNSGFVTQYSPIYGATADGANSEEFGTIPDIVSKDGEEPLKTCLDEIAKLNQN